MRTCLWTKQRSHPAALQTRPPCCCFTADETLNGGEKRQAALEKAFDFLPESRRSLNGTPQAQEPDYHFRVLTPLQRRHPATLFQGLMKPQRHVCLTLAGLSAETPSNVCSVSIALAKEHRLRKVSAHECVCVRVGLGVSQLHCSVWYLQPVSSPANKEGRRTRRCSQNKTSFEVRLPLESCAACVQVCVCVGVWGFRTWQVHRGCWLLAVFVQ